MAGPRAAGRLPLVALALGSFGIGTTEYVIMGLLPDVARDLHVTIPKAGALVTGYALSVAFGSPFLAAATVRMDRRRALLVLMGVFVLGNALCALAPSYGLLLGARVVTALCHGAFFGLGAVVAATLVRPDKKAAAIAAMFAGLTIANVLGVPLGTMLGDVLGWRDTFWAVVLVGLVAAAALHAWLPREIPTPRVRLVQEARALGQRPVVLAMAISVVSSASLFSVFTYVTPMLEHDAGMSIHGVTLVLFLFGVGLTIGNAVGGRLADWKLMPSVAGVLLLLVAVLSVLTITGRASAPASATIFVWGVLAFALIPALQSRVVHEAEQAPNLASTVNQGAFNFGNAVGASVGGLALACGVSYGQLPWIGAGLALAALTLTVVSLRFDAVASRDATPPIPIPVPSRTCPPVEQDGTRLTA